MHLLNKGVRATGLKSLSEFTCAALGAEIMVAIFQAWRDKIGAKEHL